MVSNFRYLVKVIILEKQIKMETGSNIDEHMFSFDRSAMIIFTTLSEDYTLPYRKVEDEQSSILEL